MHIYFSGIGGSGLSSLAQIAIDCGFTVSGSDLSANEATNKLQSRGAKIHFGQNTEQIQQIHQQQKIDWLVFTSALKPDHTELQFAIQNNIKTSKRHDLINFILKEFDLKLIAVAGTHGKTTTTAMLVWLFKQLQISVSYLIGSNLNWAESGEYTSQSQYFVLECDEFDRNFLHFHPDISLITSIDYDHPDTYPTKEVYLKAFAQFIQQTQKQVIPAPNLIGKLEKVRADYIFKAKIAGGFGQTKTLNKIRLPGLHNRQNAELALFTMCMILDSDTSENGIQKTETRFNLFEKINTFPGTYRRFEKLAENIYSDYAHHPTEITATLQLAKEILNEQK